MSETKQAETRAIWTSDEVVKLCADARRSTAKEIAQKLRERIGDCAGAIISLRDIEEIEREYEVK